MASFCSCIINHGVVVDEVAGLPGVEVTGAAGRPWLLARRSALVAPSALCLGWRHPRLDRQGHSWLQRWHLIRRRLVRRHSHSWFWFYGWHSWIFCRGGGVGGRVLWLGARWQSRRSGSQNGWRRWGGLRRPHVTAAAVCSVLDWRRQAGFWLVGCPGLASYCSCSGRASCGSYAGSVVDPWKGERLAGLTAGLDGLVVVVAVSSRRIGR